MRFDKEQDIKTPSIHIDIRLYKKHNTTLTEVNEDVFRISGAVENNIPGVEPTCPNSKMLSFKLINILF